MEKQGWQEAIPALRNSDAVWVRDPADKANLLARTFVTKFALPDSIENDFSFDGKNYSFYLGYFSILNTCLSMIATRLVTKKNNIGNLISTCNTLLSGSIDYLLGNIGAILTYPISFFGNYIAFRIWKKKQFLNAIDVIFFRNMAIGLILSFVLNYIAFTSLSDKAIDWKLFFAIAIPAGISFGGTFNTGRMYPDNWINWQVYNLFKISILNYRII